MSLKEFYPTIKGFFLTKKNYPTKSPYKELNISDKNGQFESVPLSSGSKNIL